jgi:uncharacterized protein YkwD
MRPNRAAPLLAACLAFVSAGVPAQAGHGPHLDEVTRLVVDKTNQLRRSKRLGSLAPNPQLAASAREFADHMARTDHYGHDADGREPVQRAQAQGYDYCLVAENIAFEYSSAGFATQELATDFVEGWKHSPGHRRNMLDDAATETGVAVARSARSGRYYAVQMFGRPNSLRRRFSVANHSTQTLSYELGGKSYPLPPRMTRTHEECRAEPLSLHLPGEAHPTTVQPADGQRYRVERVGDRLRLRG